MIKVFLKKGREESLMRFHPWVFSGAIAEIKGSPSEGDVVAVYASDGSFMAFGHYQIGTIAIRILSYEEDVLMPDFWERRIRAAYLMREKVGLVGNPETDCYRLVHGEGDLLPGLVVDYYGAPTPIQQVANVSVPEARMIQIQPWEKSMLKAIEKAILTSDIGINPTNDGTSIRLVFPELTGERRKELAKDVKKKGEAAKVAVRNIRRDGNVAFKKLKGTEISEDGIKDLEDELQKITDKYIEKIDKMVDAKSKEIMTV